MPTSSKSKKLFSKWVGFFRGLKRRTKAYVDDLQSRRPHRSFQLSRQRDYVRELALPGYITFTSQVTRTLWSYKKVFIWIAVIYVALYAVLIGVGSQETYSSLTTTLQKTSQEVFEGNWGEIGKASLLVFSVATTGLNGEVTEAQQIYAVFIILLVWLTTVWLLRNLLAGHRVRVRDGLYNAGSPILSTFLVGVVMAIQLLPVAIATIGYAAAQASGLLEGGVEAMLFWISAGLLALLSAYWVTSTLFALIIVTIPGMYPLKAIRTAGDLVVGRRVKILLRWSWMGLVIAIFWVMVLLPIILLDLWIKNMWPAVEWLPIVPVATALLSTVSLLWSSAYIYLLYRKVVDDNAN